VKSWHVEACMEDERVSAGIRTRVEHWVEARKAKLMRVYRDAVKQLMHRHVLVMDGEIKDESKSTHVEVRNQARLVCMRHAGHGWAHTMQESGANHRNMHGRGRVHARHAGTRKSCTGATGLGSSLGPSKMHQSIRVEE
jgi:hypothetical protein